MKEFRITYQLLPQSDVTASDIVIYAMSAEDAQARFKILYAALIFVSADPIS